MKKIQYMILTLVILVMSSLNAWADIIPKDLKPIYVSAVLMNSNDYPEHAFVKVEVLGDQVRGVELIEQGRGFTKGYKLNQLYLLAVPKTRFDAQRKVKFQLPEINWLEELPKHPHIQGHDFECGVDLVSRTSPLSGRDVFYKVALAGDEIKLTEVKRQDYKESAPNHVDFPLMWSAFTMTFVVELLVFLLLIKFGYHLAQPSLLKATAFVFAAQLLTLPFLWFMINHYSLMGTMPMIAAESFAVVIEAIFYRYAVQLTWRRAALAALLCNGFSYLAGMAL